MNVVPSTVVRVFWLALPPLKPAARLNAARLALRARVAASPTTQIALGKGAHPGHGCWCAVVWDASALSLTPQQVANAALTPWQPDTVSWRRDNDDQHCISAQGSSVSLEPGNADLPEAIVQACGAGNVKSLEVFGNASEQERGLWAAQLGVAVNVQKAIDLNAIPAYIPTLTEGQQLTAPALHDRALQTALRTGRAPWVAALAGLCFAAFGGWQWWEAKRTLEATHAAQAATMASLNQTESTWSAWVKKNHAGHGRESASSLLEITLPALSATAGNVKSLRYEARALNIEWSTLSPAERETFAQTLSARGLGVVSAGNKARVMWP
jgi:hypothetical protein